MINLASKLSKYGTLLTGVVAPARCMGCLREGLWLCRQCRQMLPGLPFTCIACGREHARGATCTHCRGKTALTGVVSAGPYGAPPIKRGVHWLKFKGVRACAYVLAELVLEKLPAIAPMNVLRREAVLVPIPLHKRRERERGFNQSAEIVHALSQATGIPSAGALRRKRATWTQTKLPTQLRQDNMAQAFVTTASLPNKRWWLLVDDVTTTGSTLSAAAEVLREADAGEIWGATIARG